jgi:uncharacterized membrane protein
MNTPRNWHRVHKENLTFGERAADRLRNGMGSWTFVLAFIFFMILWGMLNTWAGIHHWDVYPFILLNLFLSMLAGMQGAILLIAAKRADSISASMAEHDYQTNLESKKEVEELMALNQRQLELLEKLVATLQEKK